MKDIQQYSKTIFVLGILVCLAIVATLFILQNGKQQSLLESQAGQSLRVEDESAQYTDIKGNVVDLNSYLGQTLIIHSWASWCPQCVDQLKMFSAIVSSFPETKLLAINRAEDAVTAERFLNYYNLWSEVELLLDPTDHFYKSIGGYAMPETVIFDKNGSIKSHFRGIVSQADIETALRENAEN